MGRERHAAPGQRAPDGTTAGIWISTVNPMMPITTTLFFKYSLKVS